MHDSISYKHCYLTLTFIHEADRSELIFVILNFSSNISFSIKKVEMVINVEAVLHTKIKYLKPSNVIK